GDEFAMLPVMHTIAYMPQPVRSRSAEDAEVTHFELMTPASSWANWLLRSEYDRDWNAYLRKWQ
ncbi:MAG: hypothetical protein MUF01_11100, partial [Bryobacterales bacterium]|nr:hypothetical protein [Bryobacterales bacterium]